MSEEIPPQSENVIAELVAPIHARSPLGPRMSFMLPPVIVVAHLLQPFDHLAVEGLLDGGVRHRRGRACPVPVPHSGREPDHVTRSYLLDRPAFLLYPTETGRDDERLPERVRVPGGASPRLERDAGPRRTGRGLCREQRVDADCAGKPVGRALGGRLGTCAGDIHVSLLLSV